VLRVSDGQRSPGSRANHELKAQLTRYGGDEGNCAIGFLRLATSLFHSPKSKIVEAPEVLTVISPSDALV
jgi:hypothetical protein